MKIVRVVALFLIASVLCTVACERLTSKKEQTAPPNSEEVELQKIKDYSGFASEKAFISGISVSAGSALLCTSDGLTIYEKNADIPLPMASITKVMSVICALEIIDDLKATVTVPDKAVGIEGSSVYLTKGEQVTYEMLVYSAMLESANDATTALAILCGGTEEDFVAKMNEKAKALSMTKTHFCNPHGLSENEHYTTARDYVKLMSYALENETFCAIIGTKKMTFSKSDGSMTRVLSNHNRLLNTYKWMLGGKTGFTKASGRTLITAAKKDDTTLICITLDAPNDWHDHTLLFDAGFEAVKTTTFTPEMLKSEVDIAGTEVPLAATPPESISFSVKQDDVITHEISVPHLIFAPIEKGQQIGNVIFYKNGKMLTELPLIAEHTVDLPQENKNKGFFAQLKKFLKLGA